jgi:hypothetical protein
MLIQSPSVAVLFTWHNMDSSMLLWNAITPEPPVVQLQVHCPLPRGSSRLTPSANICYHSFHLGENFWYLDSNTSTHRDYSSLIFNPSLQRVPFEVSGRKTSHSLRNYYSSSAGYRTEINSINSSCRTRCEVTTVLQRGTEINLIPWAVGDWSNITYPWAVGTHSIGRPKQV